jgi:cytochrome P450
MVAATGIRAHLGDAIAARKASEEARDDFIGRLLASQGSEPSFSDEEIRNNVIGLIVGWVPTTASAMALAIDELLSRPEELARAQEAARSGDIDTVGAYMFEALRFQPQNSGVLRKCLSDHVLAAGTDRETLLHAGSIVYVATQSAMMDEDTLPEPEAFRVDRPWEHYLHFGYGRHTCFGEQINRVQIPEMAAVLLRQSNLRRAPGRAGKLSWDGLHPIGLDVAFDAA